MGRAQVALGEAALANAQKGLADHYLHSPCAGVATRRVFEVGDVVDMRQAILRVLEVDRVYLVSDVSEIYVRHVRVGMTVEVSVDALPGKVFSGEVSEINPSASGFNRSYRTKILIRNDGGELMPGMFGRARVVVGREAGVVAVPAP